MRCIRQRGNNKKKREGEKRVLLGDCITRYQGLSACCRVTQISGREKGMDVSEWMYERGFFPLLLCIMYHPAVAQTERSTCINTSLQVTLTVCLFHSLTHSCSLISFSTQVIFIHSFSLLPLLFSPSLTYSHTHSNSMLKIPSTSFFPVVPYASSSSPLCLILCLHFSLLITHKTFDECMVWCRMGIIKFLSTQQKASAEKGSIFSSSFFSSLLFCGSLTLFLPFYS